MALPAQTVFMDAVRLRACLDMDANGQWAFRNDTCTFNQVLPILARYVSRDAQVSVDLILQAYRRNPFMNGHASLDSNAIQIPRQFPGITSTVVNTKRRGVATPPSSSPGGFGVTALADGIAQFLVVRAKEEINAAFFKRFREKMNENPYLSRLFPGTTKELNQIGDQIYKFNLYLTTLRETFRKDMKRLPTQLAVVLQETDLVKAPHLNLLSHDALELTQLILDDYPVDSILYYCAFKAGFQQPWERNAVTDAKLRTRLEDLAAGLRVVQLFSESLRSTDNSRTWMSMAEMSRHFRDDGTFYIYLGLLWQKMEQRPIVFSNNRPFQNGLGKAAFSAEYLSELRRILRHVGEYHRSIRESLDSLKQNRLPGGKVAYEDYYQFFQGMFGLLGTGSDLREIIMDIKYDGSKYEALDELFINFLQALNEFNFDVRQQHYTSAITDLIELFDLASGGTDYAFRDELLQYGHLIGAVAEAPSGEEVALIIDAIASPVGGSQAKKHHSFSVSINGYAGLAGGIQRLEGSENPAFASVSAPLGLAFSKGLGRAGSLSLFAPVIDVGALALLRFRDDNTVELPALEWRTLFSPGAYLVYGFGADLPFSLGAGIQYGPELRSVDSTTGNTVTNSGWRIGGFLSVDIPVFNLFGR